MHCSLYLKIGHQSKKQIRHRGTCRCSSLDPSPERPSPCLKSHLNNFPFLKNHLKFGNQMQKKVLFTTICETDDMRRTFITCPMFSPVRTNPAAVSKPFVWSNGELMDGIGVKTFSQKNNFNFNTVELCAVERIQLKITHKKHICVKATCSSF